MSRKHDLPIEKMHKALIDAEIRSANKKKTESTKQDYLMNPSADALQVELERMFNELFESIDMKE